MYHHFCYRKANDMIQSISWQQYFLFLNISIGVYYLAIWIVYYNAKFPLFPGVGNFRSPSFYGEDEPDEVLHTAQHIMDELRPLFANQQRKGELILGLQRRLKKYNQWNESGFREVITAFIVSQSEQQCSIRLSEEDQQVLWQ